MLNSALHLIYKEQVKRVFFSFDFFKVFVYLIFLKLFMCKMNFTQFGRLICFLLLMSDTHGKEQQGNSFGREFDAHMFVLKPI